MSDNLFQDVVSGSGRSIRKIPVSKRSSSRGNLRDELSMGKSFSRGGGTRKRGSRFGIWFVAILTIIILFFISSVLLSGVTVKVTPKQEDVVIEGEYSAFKEPQSGELTFSIMSVERELTGEVPATGEEFVEEKASGKIVIYNNYSLTTQKLIKDTRFETPDGLIYRINEAVVVPGKKTVNGESVPGSLEVTVYSDKEGEKYNIGLTDFTIPGLKGDPRYSKFYARSKTEMTGGYSGTIKKASDEDLSRTVADLDSRLQAEILEEALSVKPDGFALLDGAYFVVTETKTSNGSVDNVLVTQKATLTGLIFEESEFAKFIAEKTLGESDGLAVSLNNTDNLKIEIVDPENNNLSSAQSIRFLLNGNTKIVWDFDGEALKADLAGQRKTSDRIKAILSKYKGIETAEVTLSPFWKRTITDNIDKIKLVTILE